MYHTVHFYHTHFIMFPLYFNKSIKEEEEEEDGRREEKEERKRRKRKQETERLELGHIALKNAIQNIIVMSRYVLEYMKQGHSIINCGRAGKLPYLNCNSS